MNLEVFLSGLILFGLTWGCYSTVLYLARIYRKHNE